MIHNRLCLEELGKKEQAGLVRLIQPDPKSGLLGNGPLNFLF